MNATTQNKLADALRGMMQFEQRITACKIDGGSAAVEKARAALAEHDAQQQQAADEATP